MSLRQQEITGELWIFTSLGCFNEDEWHPSMKSRQIDREYRSLLKLTCNYKL